MHLHTLWRSLDILGNSERLRLFLGAPADRYEAWLSDFERVPERVFLRAVDIVVASELVRIRRSTPHNRADDGPRLSKSIQILIGRCCARCPVCDSSDFAQVDPAAELNNRTALACSFCELTLTRGDLVVLASKEAANESAARVAWIRKQRSAIALRTAGAGTRKPAAFAQESFGST